MASGEMVKIEFRLDPLESCGMVTETMWAERVGAGRFRLANTPFWVRDVSHRDVVFARTRRDGRLTFAGVSLHGGHSTCWVMLRVPNDSETFRRRWAQLEALGCHYEGDGKRTLAVDVAPGADFGTIERTLRAGAVGRVWYYEVAHRGHAVGPRKSSPRREDDPETASGGCGGPANEAEDG